jgi:hypothetical protein
LLIGHGLSLPRTTFASKLTILSSCQTICHIVRRRSAFKASKRLHLPFFIAVKLSRPSSRLKSSRFSLRIFEEMFRGEELLGVYSTSSKLNAQKPR